MTNFVAVAAAALYGGLGPGLLALALSAATAAYLFITPRLSIFISGADNLLGMVLYLGDGIDDGLGARGKTRPRGRATARPPG